MAGKLRLALTPALSQKGEGDRNGNPEPEDGKRRAAKLSIGD
jgi:hypothetical protein